MAIEKDIVVEIAQVGNGFVVRPTHDWLAEHGGHPRSWVGARDEHLVFRTMEELVAWLKDHFTHRARCIQNDPE